MLPLTLLAFLLAGSEVSAPQSIPHERGSIVVSDEHNAERWTAEWTMEPTLEGGRPAVRFTETGRGHYSPYSQPVQWELEAVWSAEGSFHPLRFQKTIKDLNGRQVSTERKSFSLAKGTAQFDRKGGTGASENREFRVPPDTLTVEGIAGVLRFLPFENWRPLTIHFLTNEPRLYEMRVVMRGKERVKTPAGEFECYRIELIPNLGMLNVVRSLLPKARFWFSASSPHFWVRYAGPENGRGSPEIVMNLKSYQPDQTKR